MDAVGAEQFLIRDEAGLNEVYGEIPPGALAKEVDYIHPHYRAMIEASPFVVLATRGPEGLDASPRGDPAGFVRVADDKTLLIPDRRGNNRVDSLRNIVRDPHVALLFLIPGVGETLRAGVVADAVEQGQPELGRVLACGVRCPRHRRAMSASQPPRTAVARIFHASDIP